MRKHHRHTPAQLGLKDHLEDVRACTAPPWCLPFPVWWAVDYSGVLPLTANTTTPNGETTATGSQRQELN